MSDLGSMLDAMSSDQAEATIDWTVQPRDEDGHFQAPMMDMFDRPIVWTTED